MAEKIIVGAGLAGMTAAINLARQGHDVRILEKGKRAGGGLAYNPSPHGTPMDIKAMAAYTGIDLSPAVVPLEEITVSVWGKRYRIELPKGMPAWMVERGSRRSSMDTYLHRIAREAGVRFEFGQPVDSEKRFGELPPGSIVATGLHVAGFEAAGVPYRLMFGYFARGRSDRQGARVSVYYGDYTTDYAFTCSINGIAFALIFNRRRPVARWEVEKFAEEAALADGYALSKFQSGEAGALPLAAFDNPRLLQKGMILAGSLAGMIDPFLCFGVHGAFVSGAIAARAQRDPEVAAAEFRRFNRHFKLLMAMRGVYDRVPQDVLVKYPTRLMLRLMPLYGRFLMPHAFRFAVPGYRRMPPG
jgi:flavin-dependent dehydrogenase